MKILQISTGGLFSDGINSFIVEYMTAMDKSGMDIRVLATNNAEESTIQRVKESGCEVVSIPYRKQNIIKYFFKLFRYIAKEKIDIVHVHGSSAIMSVELLAAKLAGCKVRIAHSHNTICENQRVDQILRPVFDKLYTECFSCGQEAGKWLFGNRKFIVIPNGRSLKKYEYNQKKRLQYRKELHIPDDALVIGHVGRFNEQKNHKYLIQIFYEFHKRYPKSYLVLIGTGDTVTKVKQQVTELELENYVVFTGAVNNVPDYLSAFDVMLLPSLYEGLPLVVIEWQISGLPCLISDNITNECKITSFVEFESIETTPETWAKDIVELKIEDRNINKDKIFKEVRDAGYDIDEDAKKLKKLYESLYSFIK